VAKKSQYQQLGVDAHKKGVKKAFSGVIRNECPHAFVNIVTDPENQEMAVTKHSDGSGSKSIQRLLHYRQTGNPTIFQHDADDGLGMNFGDVAAAGFLGPYFVTDALAINGDNAPKKIIMEQIAIGIAKLVELYRKYGIPIYFLGGETADLLDQVNSYVFDADVFARTSWENVITGEVEPGDDIYGLSSGGQASWEELYNSGIMSNGQTLARYKLMMPGYSESYPFLCRKGRQFEGRFQIASEPDDLLMTVGEAILSPTRQWPIFIKLLIEALKERGDLHLLHGITMNTGGGATKILNLGRRILFAKKMPRPLPIFKLIQKESRETWENMFTAFNCGIGLDIIGSPRNNGVLWDEVLRIANLVGIDAYKLGSCRRTKGRKNQVILYTQYGEFHYSK